MNKGLQKGSHILRSHTKEKKRLKKTCSTDDRRKTLHFYRNENFTHVGMYQKICLFSPNICIPFFRILLFLTLHILFYIFHLLPAVGAASLRC